MKPAKNGATVNPDKAGEFFLCDDFDFGFNINHSFIFVRADDMQQSSGL